MTVFTYYLFDQGANMVTAEAATHDDILDAFERMRGLLDEFEMIAMVQLWEDEEFVGHLKRSDGRLILKSNANPVPLHPLAQDSARDQGVVTAFFRRSRRPLTNQNAPAARPARRSARLTLLQVTARGRSSRDAAPILSTVIALPTTCHAQEPAGDATPPSVFKISISACALRLGAA